MVSRSKFYRPIEDDDNNDTLINSQGHNLHENRQDNAERLKTFRDILKKQEVASGTHIKILVTGRVGRGKSALINSILEEKKVVAVEDNTGESVTSEVKTISHCTPEGYTISLIDSPGLGYFSDQNDRKFYENIFGDMMIQGEKTNVVLYCKKMTDHRFEPDELNAIRMLYHTFGPQFWEHVIIVLTFANHEKCAQVEKNDPPTDNKDAWKQLIKKRFTELLIKRTQELQHFLTAQVPMPLDVVKKVRFVPAGYYKPDDFHYPEPLHLPDRSNWLESLLRYCCYSKENVTLSTINLRENLHLAIIFDNEGEPDENIIIDNDEIPNIKLNPPACNLKKFLQNNGHLVLCFNSLSIRSVSKLLQVIMSTIKPYQLAAVSLIILSKHTNFEDVLIKFDVIFESFDKVPKFFFTHIDSSSKAVPVLPKLPPNSIGLTVKSNNLSWVMKLFNENVEASLTKPMTDCFASMKINLESYFKALYDETFVVKNIVMPSIYMPFTENARLEFSKKKLDILRVIWRKTRSETYRELCDNKEEIRKVLRNERIARIATGVTGVVIGGGLVIGGIVAAPFTAGAGLGLAVAGGTIGAATSVGGISAMITKKIMSNDRLKKAQEQVTLDQQLSTALNESVNSYYVEMHNHKTAIDAGARIAGGLAAGGALGMLAAIGAEGALEGGAVALRAAGRIAGMALAGVSLAVTVPIDVIFIAYHSARLHQAKRDDSGADEKDGFVRWYVQQIEGLLLDTITLYNCNYIVKAELTLSKFGFEIQGTIPEHTYTIRTLFSGPFKLPPTGATIVSAVYDVSFSKKLDQPLSVNVNHCLNVTNDDLYTRKMSFAVGKLDHANRIYSFELKEGGHFDDSMGTIAIEESCQICIVYTGKEINKPIKYAAVCSYDKLYRNSWNMTILFTKYLDAHLQFLKREFTLHSDEFKMQQFQFLPECTEIQEQFKKMSIRDKEWIIASTENTLQNQTEISSKRLNVIEIQANLSDSPVDKIPYTKLCVQVIDEKNADDEFSYQLQVEGTDLVLLIERKKDKIND